MKAYYNEFDPKAVSWIRQLIANGLIMDGVVDDRSIIDVQQSDLKGFTRHHFFAGIGGWELALQLANWPIDRPVCTASLPCQPFSVAGTQKGKEDERHLLPHFIELVKQCNFQTIFGEQVPGAIKHGWLDDLCTEMEREKYTVGSIVLTAAGEGAPHIRQRLYWVADSINKGSQRRLSGWQNQEREAVSGHSGCDSTVSGLSDTKNRDGRPESQLTASGGRESWNKFGGDGSCSGMGDTKHDGQSTSSQSRSDVTTIQHSTPRSDSSSESKGTSTSRIISEWSDPDWLYCRDEKYRPIKPSIEPLAHGLSRGVGYSSDSSEQIEPDNTQEARIMRLKGYGNAIVPQVAASFIKAFLES